jgi:exonuclease-1
MLIQFQIIFKLDKNGNAQQLLLSQLGNNSEKDLDLRNFTRENFRHMCIISGCDYLEGLPGLGLKTAHQFVSKHKEISMV